MTGSYARLTSLFILTVVAGIVATMFAPALAGTLAHGQSAPGQPAATPPGTARITVARANRALERGDTLTANEFTLVDTTIAWHWTTVTPE